MKKKLSVVRSQQKIATGPLQQPTTHKLLSQSKQKKSGIVGIRNKENESVKPSIEVRESEYDRPTALIPHSVTGASSTSGLLRQRFDRSVKDRLGDGRGQSKKVQPTTDKSITGGTPKYNSITSHREPSYSKQFLFPHSNHSNSQKPTSSSARGKRFSSIRRSEAQVTLGGEELRSQKPHDPSLSKNEKKQSVWGKRQLVLTSERQRKPLKESTVTNITPSTTSKEKSSLAKFCTQLPAPKAILTVSSYSNLFATHHQPINHYYVSTLIEAFSDRSNNTSFMQLTRNHLMMTLQVLNITKNVDRPLSSGRPISEPPSQNVRNTLVFDLDETLIHCNESIEVPHDVLLNITFPNGDSTKAGVNVRPHAQETLKELAEMFDLVIFTASHECYANVVIDYLDPKGTLIKGRYFRDSCFRTPEGLYIKDLRVLNRPLDKLILIDNAAYSYAFQLDNGVPVIPFYDDKADMELRQLCHYLKPMAQSKDIRKDNSKYFKTRHYLNFTDPAELIRTLYGSFLQTQQ